MTRSLEVAILVFDDVEVLDFCGPFEVFSVANREREGSFNVHLVAESEGIIGLWRAFGAASSIDAGMS